MASRGPNQLTARERIKSPIVRIDLQNSEEKKENSSQKPSQQNDSTDEHIANLQDTNNDSMVGDLN